MRAVELALHQIVREYLGRTLGFTKWPGGCPQVLRSVRVLERQFVKELSLGKRVIGIG